MDINFYHRISEGGSSEFDKFYIHPFILLSDSITYSTRSANYIILYMNIDTWKDEIVERLVPSFFPTTDDQKDVLGVFNQLQPMIKQMRNLKHKSKEVLVAIAGYHQRLKQMRKIMKLDVEIMFEKTQVLSLIPFIEKKIWNIWFSDYNYDPTKEDWYIADLTETIIEKKKLLAFDTMVDKLFKPTLLQASEDQDFEFISVPLWNTPPLPSLNYEQLLHSRENVRIPLIPFKNDLRELSAQLFPLEFSSENMPKIRQLITEKIIPHQEPIQRRLDESLYIIKLRNTFPKDFYMTFCLGIMSAENLVNYYEMTGNIEPYVCTQIKQQLGRHINPKASYVFTYFGLHAGKPLD